MNIVQPRSVRLPNRMSDWLGGESDNRFSREVGVLAAAIGLVMGQMCVLNRLDGSVRPLAESDTASGLASDNYALCLPIENYLPSENQQEVVVITKLATFVPSGITWPSQYFAMPSFRQFVRSKLAKQVVNISPESSSRLGFTADDHSQNYPYGLFTSLVGATYYSAQIIHQFEHMLENDGDSSGNDVSIGFQGHVARVAGNRYKFVLPQLAYGQLLSISIGSHTDIEQMTANPNTSTMVMIGALDGTDKTKMSISAAEAGSGSFTPMDVFDGSVIQLDINTNADLIIKVTNNEGTPQESTTTVELPSGLTVPVVNMLIFSLVDGGLNPETNMLAPITLVHAGDATPMTVDPLGGGV